MAGGNVVKVTFAEVAQAASDIKNIHQTVEQHLSDLKAKIQPVTSEWTGQASEAYQASQQKWDAASADLFATLAAIGSAVQQAGDAYEGAEGHAKGLWG